MQVKMQKSKKTTDDLFDLKDHRRLDGSVFITM